MLAVLLLNPRGALWLKKNLIIFMVLIMTEYFVCVCSPSCAPVPGHDWYYTRRMRFLFKYESFFMSSRVISIYRGALERTKTGGNVVSASESST